MTVRKATIKLLNELSEKLLWICREDLNWAVILPRYSEYERWSSRYVALTCTVGRETVAEHTVKGRQMA